MKYSYIILFALLVVLVTSQEENKKPCGCGSTTKVTPEDPIKPCERCNRNIELGIVLDISNSIWVVHLNTAKQFLNKFLEYFNVSQTETRVALTPYAGEVFDKQAFYLDTHHNINDVQKAIAEVYRLRNQIAQTETGDAIAFMNVHQLNSDRTRKDVRRACLVLTDGNSQDKKKTEREAKKARDDGIHMFAVGVGNKVDQTELTRIAGVENPEHVNHVGTFAELFDVLTALVKKTCSLN